MSDEQKGFCGCVILVIVALLIGVGLRSRSFAQFLTMGGVVIIGILALLWSLNGFSEEGCLNKLWGVCCGIVCLVSVACVGNFLVTGNYEQSIKLISWNAGQATLTPAAPVQAVETATATPPLPPTYTPTPAPIPQPTITPTSMPSPQPGSTGAIAPTATPSPVTQGTVAGDWQGLSETDLAREQVAVTLNEVWALPAPEAARAADELRAIGGTVSGEGQRAAGLLMAVAIERSGDVNAASTVYQEIAKVTPSDPYAVSAAFRKRFLEKPQRNRSEAEKFYATIFGEPEVEGWFLVSDQWEQDTTRRLAAQALVDMRADQLAFRFFQFLRSQALFPQPYAYLFILLVLTIGAKIVMLPLYAKAAQNTVRLRRLLPEMQMIQAVYKDDPLVMNQRLAEFYQRHGISTFLGGCGALIVDMIFVISALVALGGFMPQLVLDNARFWWIPDVTQRDLSILVIWALFNWIVSVSIGASQQLQQQLGQSPIPASCSFAVGGVVSVGIAWFLKWPSYVFIFWLLLSVLGMLINGILTVIFVRE